MSASDNGGVSQQGGGSSSLTFTSQKGSVDLSQLKGTGPGGTITRADVESAGAVTLHLPGDASYHDARRVHNGLIDKHPAVIACCRGTDDVAAVLRHLNATPAVAIGYSMGGPVAQLLWLASEDPDKPINMYVNSPGGMVYSGLGIYDTMQFIQPDVATMCVGLAASRGSVLLAAGAPG